jgi:metallo-beta-lactamase family protein
MFFDAGHVLGSSIVRIEAEGKTILFSGDLGNSPPPIIRSTEKLEAADYCVIESTYGDRVHENAGSRREMLEDAVEETVARGGTLMIPAFALERTQELLFHLHELFEQGRVPKAPVFLDSPLAIKLTEVYRKYESYYNHDMQRLVRSGDDFLNFPELHLTLTTEQSKEIAKVPPPKIIIAGSGMSHGGRILFHERLYLPDPQSAILCVGYQTKGSLGRAIMDGAAKVHIFGEEVSVRAKKLQIAGYSAHADQPQLLNWLRPLRRTLKKAFVVQGESGASEALTQKIRDELAVDAVVPQKGESFEL